MANDKHSAQWLGRPIFNQAHSPDLERQAAIFEFGHGLDRQTAEEEAYKKYTSDHHAKAAAHHLTQMKAARSTGAFDAAAQHSSLYAAHISKLGFSPYDGPPSEVMAHVNQGPSQIEEFAFKPHDADMHLLIKATPMSGYLAPSEHPKLTVTDADNKAFEQANFHSANMPFNKEKGIVLDFKDKSRHPLEILKNWLASKTKKP